MHRFKMSAEDRARIIGPGLVKPIYIEAGAEDPTTEFETKTIVVAVTKNHESTTTVATSSVPETPETRKGYRWEKVGKDHPQQHQGAHFRGAWPDSCPVCKEERKRVE